MNIVNLFFEAAQAHPTKRAIVTHKESVTFTQLQNDVRQTASYFKKKGIKNGDRVLVFIPMSIDLYRTVLALFHIGAIAVFLDEWVSKKRLGICCELAECKGFIANPKLMLLGVFSKQLRNIPIWLNPIKKKGDTFEPYDLPVSHPALITFTTGSTGTPKAANRSHGFLEEQFKALGVEIKPSSADVCLTTLPIVLFLNLGVGCTSVIANYNSRKPAKNDFTSLVGVIEQEKVTQLIASPFFVKSLSDEIISKNKKLPYLNKIFTGGGPVFPQEAKLYQEAFPKAFVKVVYGSTEAEPISSIILRDLLASSTKTIKGLNVGAIHESIKLKVISIQNNSIQKCKDEALREMVLDNGQIGEIIVSGNHVLKTYFKGEQFFKRNKIVTDSDIWHRTGDSGFFENGNLYLTGSVNQLFLENEKWFSPFLLENELLQIDGITGGTIVLVQQQKILVVESTLPESTLQKLLVNIPYDQILVYAEIPRDPRHHTKIEYGLLRAKIEKDIRTL